MYEIKVFLGKSINRFSMNDKIKAYIKIIEMISNTISNVNLQCFPDLEQKTNSK